MFVAKKQQRWVDTRNTSINDSLWFNKNFKNHFKLELNLIEDIEIEKWVEDLMRMPFIYTVELPVIESIEDSIKMKTIEIPN